MSYYSYSRYMLGTPNAQNNVRRETPSSFILLLAGRVAQSNLFKDPRALRRTSETSTPYRSDSKKRVIAILIMEVLQIQLVGDETFVIVELKDAP